MSSYNTLKENLYSNIEKSLVTIISEILQEEKNIYKHRVLHDDFISMKDAFEKISTTKFAQSRRWIVNHKIQDGLDEIKNLILNLKFALDVSSPSFLSTQGYNDFYQPHLGYIDSLENTTKPSFQTPIGGGDNIPYIAPESVKEIQATFRNLGKKILPIFLNNSNVIESNGKVNGDLYDFDSLFKNKYIHAYSLDNNVEQLIDGVDTSLLNQKDREIETYNLKAFYGLLIGSSFVPPVGLAIDARDVFTEKDATLLYAKELGLLHKDGEDYELEKEWYDYLLAGIAGVANVFELRMLAKTPQAIKVFDYLKRMKSFDEKIANLDTVTRRHFQGVKVIVRPIEHKPYSFSDHPEKIDYARRNHFYTLKAYFNPKLKTLTIKSLLNDLWPKGVKAYPNCQGDTKNCTVIGILNGVKNDAYIRQKMEKIIDIDLENRCYIVKHDGFRLPVSKEDILQYQKSQEKSRAIRHGSLGDTILEIAYDRYSALPKHLSSKEKLSYQYQPLNYNLLKDKELMSSASTNPKDVLTMFYNESQIASRITVQRLNMKELFDDDVLVGPIELRCDYSMTFGSTVEDIPKGLMKTAFYKNRNPDGVSISPKHSYYVSKIFKTRGGSTAMRVTDTLYGIDRSFFIKVDDLKYFFSSISFVTKPEYRSSDIIKEYKRDFERSGDVWRGIVPPAALLSSQEDSNNTSYSQLK
jgi:hypothetical protein